MGCAGVVGRLENAACAAGTSIRDPALLLPSSDLPWYQDLHSPKVDMVNPSEAMSEPTAAAHSLSGHRTARALAMGLIALLAVNFGLIALAVHAPSPPQPTSILLSGPIPHTPRLPEQLQLLEDF